MTRGLPALVACACAAGAACGDNRRGPDDDPLAAASGARLALQRYRYDDGTEQIATGEFYDTKLHALCRAQRWTDGAMRCVPAADDAEYSDANCTALVGLGRTITRPAFFTVYDGAPAGGVVAHVFRAGAMAQPIAQYYARTGDTCTGPIALPPDARMFFALGDEVDRSDLVGFHDEEVGDGRIGFLIRTGDDGVRVAWGLRDRELGACTPRVQGDGKIACEPLDAPAATYFRDAACREPMVAVGAAAVPAIARLIEPSGCASYHRVGAELSPPVFRRDGDACTPAEAPAGGRLFAVEGAIGLPEIDRPREAAPGRRLQRIWLGHGGLAIPDDRLFDPTTASECRPRTIRDAIRCLPANLATAIALFSEPACTGPVRVVELPRQACAPPSHATTSRPFQVRPIVEPVAGTLYRTEGPACVPYVPAPGNELRALGPPIDLTAFIAAIYYSERAP